MTDPSVNGAGVCVLDTNVVVEVLRPRPSPVRDRLRIARDHQRRAITVSSVALAELWHGIARSARPAQNAELLRRFLAGGVETLAFGAEDAEIAGALRAHLERAGTPIGPYDVLIAAHARRLGCTLVTANVGEFSRVPDLIWENWSLPG